MKWTWLPGSSGLISLVAADTWRPRGGGIQTAISQMKVDLGVRDLAGLS
jgi:hypothetical protein